MRIENLGHDELMRLGAAAAVGNATLAHDLEEIGLSDRDESLTDARALRPEILAAIEEARGS
jgi:hypothetical protein